ncbi:MAG TPA: serine hydrolase domain-containing protein [Gemmatimonadaceae bacterium]|nr:serine hydrolase domain-containing protein [Gemmatimonadaceae bacterium]
MRKVALIVALLASTSLGAPAQRAPAQRERVQSTAAQRTADRPTRLVRAMAEQLLATANLPGLSIAVSRNGQIVFAEGLGYADIERKRPITPDTRFRTASVSKIITVTALAKLVEEGRLDLDAPIQKYVPSFPAKAWPITSRQIAGHLSGMPHYSDADRIEPRFYPSVTDALSVFAHESLKFEPGTAYSYSTHGFTLLSAAIEGAAGEPFLEYVQRSVLDPLGMRSTAPDLRARPHPAMATIYRSQNDRLSRVEQPEDASYKWAGGGLTSTPTDLLRLAHGYFDGFLMPETVSLMWTSQRLASGKETGVGIAWRNGRDMAGHRTIEHAGSMEGVRLVVCIFPEERLVISLMTNREWPSAVEETAHTLAFPFLTNDTARAPLAGTHAITVETNTSSGKRTRPGILTLDDGRGTLRIDPQGPDGAAYALFYLGRGDAYGLVRHDGIYWLTIRVENGVLSGRAIAHRSPQLEDPATNPPFLTFTSRAAP